MIDICFFLTISVCHEDAYDSYKSCRLENGIIFISSPT